MRRFFTLLFISVFCLEMNSQTITISQTTPNVGGSFNIQAALTGAAGSCSYQVTFMCSTCSPTTLTCDTPTPNGSCAVTFTGMMGSSVSITATAVRIAGPNNSNCPATITIAPITVLPVHFSKFTADNVRGTSALAFTTASEVNNEYFTIERSADGIDYKAIGTIKGAGNSNQAIDYRFVDEAPLSGVNYYRVKQTDFDGKYDYSETRMVRQISKGNFTITPSSTSGNLTIATDHTDYAVYIYSTSGALVKQFDELSDTQNITIDELQAGVYFAKVAGDNATETVRIIKF